jgi:hypothetical protein
MGPAGHQREHLHNSAPGHIFPELLQWSPPVTSGNTFEAAFGAGFNTPLQWSPPVTERELGNWT